jgi:hypothetical protein
MARQKGLIKLEGTIGDITFFKTRDGYLAKENDPISAARIKNDASFERTRENMSEFGHAGKASKSLRNAVRPLLLNAKDGRMVSRLTKEMVKVVKADSTSVRGKRNVLDGETELLEGFEFNIDAKLSTTIFARYESVIDRVAGTLTLNIPSFIPLKSIVAPDGTTHYKIVTLGAEVDFENDSNVNDQHETAVLPWDNAPTAVVNLVNTVTANSAHPLFLLVGIEFYQLVNGLDYPLKNGAFNSLQLAKVSGG